MYDYFPNLQLCFVESLQQGPLCITLIYPSASDCVAQVWIFGWCLGIWLAEKFCQLVGSSKKLYFSES